MTSQHSSVPKIVLEFKSTSLVAPVLVLSSVVLADIDQQLSEKVAQAPEFFKHSPLIIDFQKLVTVVEPIEVGAVVALVRKHGFLPIGIRGGTELHHAQALALDLPVHSLHSQTTPLVEKKQTNILEVKPEDQELAAEPAVTALENRIITHPIRSGQRVYVKGDLIVLSAVSAGAEIMAEGNIHVYGSLRGRALAGVLGNTESRIFCSDLQAELVSIAGIYKLKDDLVQYPQQTPMQIVLEGDLLNIQPI